MRAILVTRQVVLRERRTATNHCASSQRFSSWSVSCHVANEESSHERDVFPVRHHSQECLNQLYAETCHDGKCALHRDRVKRSFGFFQNVTMTRSMMNGHEVMVRICPFLMEQVPLVSVLKMAASSIPFTIQAALTSSLLF